MAWRTVVITKHCKISAKLNYLVVQTSDDVVQIPLSDIGVLVLATTRAAITTHCLAQCTTMSIRIITCDDHSIPVGEMNSYSGGNQRNNNIRSQMNWSQEKKRVLWQYIVKQKIASQSRILKLVHSTENSEIEHLIPAVLPGDTNNREAVAAHMYFPRLFGYEFTRSDDSNPINALLNYGYSIVLSETARQINAAGYLTELGINHDSDKNPFNLASDLMEPFRPFVDRRVFSLEEQELNPDNKLQLISLLQEEELAFNTTLSIAIGKFVRECLSYLSTEHNLPSMELTECDTEL